MFLQTAAISLGITRNFPIWMPRSSLFTRTLRSLLRIDLYRSFAYWVNDVFDANGIAAPRTGLTFCRICLGQPSIRRRQHHCDTPSLSRAFPPNRNFGRARFVSHPESSILIKDEPDGQSAKVQFLQMNWNRVPALADSSENHPAFHILGLLQATRGRDSATGFAEGQVSRAP